VRAVLTVERYFPAIGGAERVVQRVAEGLAARGHDVTVVTGGARSQESIGDVRVERFPVGGNLAHGFRGDPSEALAEIERAAPDVLMNYAAQSWATDACIPFLDRPDRPRMVLAPCGFSGLGSPAYASYFESMRDWLPRYDALVFHSATYRDWEFAAAAGADRRHVVPNGADPPAATRRLRASVGGDERLVVTVGSHVRTKGHRDFIRAVARLREIRPARGAIVAPPRHGADVVRGCNPYCVARTLLPRSPVRLFDGSEPAAAPDAIASADVFVLPSQIECSPLVVIEAMAAGVPWVSYDVGNVRELAGGLVVSTLDELVAAAAEILDGRHEELGPAGSTAWRRDHQWSSIVERYEEIFSEALERAA
jgi:glycosyltransferase involved in cell wall biosynthesis